MGILKNDAFLDADRKTPPETVFFFKSLMIFTERGEKGRGSVGVKQRDVKGGGYRIGTNSRARTE